MSRIFLLLLSALLLTGCASGYEKFYQPLPVNIGAGLAPFTGEPRLVSGEPDPKVTILKMFEQGYAPIGIASFVGPAANPTDALEQAKTVGAAIVAINTKYQNTVSGSIPLTLPHTTTSYDSGTANVYGPYGSATGTYSGTTTTYDTQTTYILIR